MADGLDVLMSSGGQAPSGSGLDVLMTGVPDKVPMKEAYKGAPLTRFDRFLKGAKDVTDAGAQMLTHALPDGAVNAVNNATSYVNGLPVLGPVTKALGMTPATAQSIDNDIAQSEKQYQLARQQGAQNLSTLVTGKPADPGTDWMRMAGNIAATAPIAYALPAATGVGGALAQGAVFGGISQPVTEGDFVKEKAKQVGFGAATSGATNLALRGIASVISPTIRPEVQTLLDAGVTPTPGQILGGGFSRAEQGATSIPVLGDMIRNSQRRGVEQFNTAAINRSLAPIGEELPAGVVGRDAIEHASSRLGAAYDRVLSRIRPVPADNQFLNEISNLGNLVDGLPDAQVNQFRRIIDTQIMNRFDQHGLMTGEALKAAESNLGDLARGYGRATDFDQRQMATALREAQSQLRDMLARSQPQFAQELQSINTGYANLMRPQQASASLGADSGVFTAAQLQNAVKALDPSKGKRQFATGNALMQDLSEAGKSVLSQTVPDSGTPFRHAIQVGGAALLGHSMLPESMAAMALPAAGGLGLMSLPYTQLGQRASAALLTQRPDIAPQIARGLLSTAPAAPLLATSLVNGK